ncbi:MAG: hypothetical protein N3G80_03020 [Candidatus Micrarchaeota archaeon]|nr:hypothetical protein [Candidatus Micrarchaeota archaeon]
MWYYKFSGREKKLPFPSPAEEIGKKRTFYYKILDATASVLKQTEKKEPGQLSVFFDKLAERELERAEQKRSKESLLWKASGEISKATNWMMKQKTKMLKKIGLDEQKIIDFLGVKNAFRLAKFGSKIDICNEALSLLVFWGSLVCGTAIAISCIKRGQASIQEMMESFKPLFKYSLFALAVIAPLMRAMNWVGNALDVFQHILMDAIAARLKGKAKEAAEKEYDAFKRESIRELIVDAAIGIVQVPFIDILRRIRAIRLELRQLGHIARMEKMYFAAKEKNENQSSF